MTNDQQPAALNSGHVAALASAVPEEYHPQRRQIRSPLSASDDPPLIDELPNGPFVLGTQVDFQDFQIRCEAFPRWLHKPMVKALERMLEAIIGDMIPAQLPRPWAGKSSASDESDQVQSAPRRDLAKPNPLSRAAY